MLTRDSVLFYWDSALDLQPVVPAGLAPSFSRAGAGLARDRSGNYRSVLPGVPRFTWHQVDGLYRPCYLNEAAATNLLLQSCDFSSAQAAWAGTGGYSAITARPSVIAGQTAYEHTNTSGSSSARAQIVGTLTGAVEALSIVVERGTAAEAECGIFNDTAGTWVARASYNWTTGAVTITQGAGTAWVEQVAPGIIRLHLLCTGTAGGTRRCYLYPTGTGSGGASNGTATLHHAQLTAGPVPCSPIVTTSTAVARVSDFLQYEVQALGVPPFIIYWRGVFRHPLPAVTGTSLRMLEMGQNSTGGQPRLLLFHDDTHFRFQLGNGTTTLTQTTPLSTANVTAGSVVELLAIMTLDAKLSIQRLVNGGSWAASAQTVLTGGYSPLPFLRLGVGSANNSASGVSTALHQAVKVVRTADVTSSLTTQAVLEELRDFELTATGEVIL